VLLISAHTEGDGPGERCAGEGVKLEVDMNRLLLLRSMR